MALLAYDRIRLFWGAFDAEKDIPAYTPAQRTSLGASAVPGSGIGVRRVQLVFARQAPATYAEDVAVCHFDFVNYTSGAPDDSWIAADFAALEGYLNTMWTSLQPKTHTGITLREYRWYRVGPGVGKPNPAVRVTARGVAGTAGSSAMPPQIAVSVTARTASRRLWGRTYLPCAVVGEATTDGHVVSTCCDTIANAVNTMYVAAAAADFAPVVYCPSIGSALSIEQVSVDNIYDVIRSRRWQSTTYRKVLP